MIIDEGIKSVLNLKNIIVKKIEFDRDKRFISSEQLTFKIGYNTKELEDKDDYEVALKVLIEDSEKQTFRLLIEIIGYFGFDSKEDVHLQNKEIIIQKNTLAILFPYLRSQVTLITAQPGMEPIIIPPININSLIEKAKSE